MEVSFEEGAAGFHEARALLAIARATPPEEFTADHESAVLDALKTAGEVHLARDEFTALRAEFEVDDSARGAAAEEDGWWARLFGPSRREQLMSAQRSLALERASRAEQASFEALAETARVARERDAAHARIAELERELHALRQA
jgi:hypothetical protein